MKKLIALVLALVCVFGFFACNQSQVTDETKPNVLDGSQVAPGEYFQVQKNDNGIIVFVVVAGCPQAKYTYKDVNGEEYVEIVLNNENGEVNGLLFDLLDGKSTVSAEENNPFTHSISMTFSYTADNGYSEITVVYEFKWTSTSNTITIFKNNKLVGTVLLSDDEMSAFKNNLNTVKF